MRKRKPRPTDTERLTWLLRVLRDDEDGYLYTWSTGSFPASRRGIDRAMRAEGKGKR